MQYSRKFFSLFFAGMLGGKRQLFSRKRGASGVSGGQQAHRKKHQ